MSLNNEIRLMGNVVKEPDIFESDRGKFGKVRIASNTKRGETEETLFIDIKLFGYSFNDFEYFNIEKGDRIVAYGRLVIEEFTDKEGNKRREPTVYANNVFKVAKKTSTSNEKSF